MAAGAARPISAPTTRAGRACAASRSARAPSRGARGTEAVRVDELFCRRIRGASAFQAIGTVDARGDYRVEGLAPGAYELVVDATDVPAQSFELELTAPETRFDVELPAGRIEGRLLGVEFEPERSEFERRHVLVFPYGWYQESGNRGSFSAPDAAGHFMWRYLP